MKKLIFGETDTQAPAAGVPPVIIDTLEREEAKRAATLNEHERYDRQKRIWGEEGQRRLTNSVATVIGSGPLAMYAAMPLAALGVGQVRILGSGEYRPGAMALDIPVGGKSCASGLEEVMRKLNPNVNVLGVPIALETRLAEDYLTESTLIIDTTNSPRSKAIAGSFADNHRLPFLSAGVAEGYAKLACVPRDGKIGNLHIMPEFEGSQQDPLLSLLWGGVIAEEAKKCIIGGALPTSPTYYQHGADDRFTFLTAGMQQTACRTDSLRDKRALVVGAGALGNGMALAFAHLGLRQVDWLDYDTVESHNVNRQVLFYDAVGKPKAATLAEKLMRMSPGTESRGIPMMFEIKGGEWSVDTLGTEYDVIFDLVDNLYARAVISAYAVSHGVPLISAASSPDAAQVALFAPGRSSCMDHVFGGYYENGRKEEIIRRQSCIRQPDPSVIMTNQVGAALAGLAAASLFDERVPVFNGSLKYSATLDPRFGQNPIRTICDCYQHRQVPDMEIRDEEVLPPEALATAGGVKA